MEEIHETSIQYDEPTDILHLAPTPEMENAITFHANGQERLRFAPDGVYINGEKITDSLKVYDRFSEWLTDAGYPPIKPTRRKQTKKTKP